MYVIFCACLLSRPAWGAWIEMYRLGFYFWALMSRPAWGAWIEISQKDLRSDGGVVAPRMGRVD